MLWLLFCWSQWKQRGSGLPLSIHVEWCQRGITDQEADQRKPLWIFSCECFCISCKQIHCHVISVCVEMKKTWAVVQKSVCLCEKMHILWESQDVKLCLQEERGVYIWERAWNISIPLSNGKERERAGMCRQVKAEAVSSTAACFRGIKQEKRKQSAEIDGALWSGRGKILPEETANSSVVKSQWLPHTQALHLLLLSPYLRFLHFTSISSVCSQSFCETVEEYLKKPISATEKQNKTHFCHSYLKISTY